jgi:hypothetical protein
MKRIDYQTHTYNMEIYDVVKKLTGNINPAGSGAVDPERFDNLEITCKLIEKLVADVRCVASVRNSHEHSMKKAGEFANKFLTELNQ